MLSKRLHISLLLVILSFGVTTVHSQTDGNPIPLLYEDFSAFPATGYSTSITTFPDTYTNTPGWMGLRVQRATSSSGESDACGVIIGRTDDGVLYTPAVTTSGHLTVVLDIKSYSVKGNYVLVFACHPETGAQLLDSANDNRFYVDYADFTTTDTRLFLHIDYTGTCRLLISPNNAAHLHSVAVYDGTYEATDIATSISHHSSTINHHQSPTTYNLQGQPTIIRHGLYIKDGKVHLHP